MTADEIDSLSDNLLARLAKDLRTHRMSQSQYEREIASLNRWTAERYQELSA